MKLCKFFLFNILSVLLSCQNDTGTTHEELEIPTEPESPEELTELKGSVWKLDGIVDVQSGEMKKLEPSHCEECYSLVFDTDSTLTAFGIHGRLKLDLNNLNPPERFDQIVRCQVYDFDGFLYCDYSYFYEAFISVDSFSVTRNELRLICSRGLCYLSFLPHEGKNPSTSRIGTRWKLEGIGDVETGELKELEPAECDECYWLYFMGEYSLLARSLVASQSLNLLNLDLAIDPTRPLGYDNNLPPLYGEKLCSDCIPYEDSYLFRCGIAYTESYEFTPDGLKLLLFFIYEEKKCYLLFKLVYL